MRISLTNDADKKNRSVILDRASNGWGEDKLGSNNGKFDNKNLTNYTFGGKTNIKGSKIENLAKRDYDEKTTTYHIDDSIYPSNLQTS